MGELLRTTVHAKIGEHAYYRHPGEREAGKHIGDRQASSKYLRAPNPEKSSRRWDIVLHAMVPFLEATRPQSSPKSPALKTKEVLPPGYRLGNTT